MIKRIVKNWITTSMGIITFLFALTCLWCDKGNIWVNVILILLAAVLVRSKDKVLEKLTFGLLKIKEDE